MGGPLQVKQPAERPFDQTLLTLQLKDLAPPTINEAIQTFAVVFFIGLLSWACDVANVFNKAPTAHIKLIWVNAFIGMIGLVFYKSFNR